MSRLTEQEQQEIIRFIEADKPLPERYRFLLFEDKREVLTKNWTDWVNYWAVDFNFESKREIIRVKSEETGSGKNSGRGITSASPTLRNTRMPTGVTT